MDSKKRSSIIGAISGAFGGGLSAVSGSRSWVVVSLVGAILALITAWIIAGMIKSD